jgi:DNA-binding NtrC family response regulator
MGALSLLERSNVDLVISDILMPVLNGYALVARLREKWPDMPVILTTGFLSPDAAKSMMKGSVDFIPKPINAETLLDMVRGRVAPVELITSNQVLTVTPQAIELKRS